MKSTFKTGVEQLTRIANALEEANRMKKEEVKQREKAVYFEKNSVNGQFVLTETQEEHHKRFASKDDSYHKIRTDSERLIIESNGIPSEMLKPENNKPDLAKERLKEAERGASFSKVIYPPEKVDYGISRDD